MRRYQITFFSSIYILGIIFSFAIGFALKENINKNIILESDTSYQSLIGKIETIPEVKRWSVHRSKIKLPRYEKYNWDITIYFNNDNSFSIIEDDFDLLLNRLDSISIDEFIRALPKKSMVLNR